MTFIAVLTLVIVFKNSWDLHSLKRDVSSPSYEFIAAVRQHVVDHIKTIIRREIRKHYNADKKI